MTPLTYAPCPLTGVAPCRHIQTISKPLFIALWKYSFGVDVSQLITSPLNMWESPCGLIYFHPAIPGDDLFYQTLYQKIDLHAKLSGGLETRLDHQIASQHILPEWQVLDVGCGSGKFKEAIPQACYTGLDPFAEAEITVSGVIRQDLQKHIAERPAFYDAVCAFHVIEHTPDPRTFIATLLSALKPGGLIIFSSPTWPSIMTRLPNFVFNAPPHHLTWWNARAYAALCDQFKLAPLQITSLRGARSNQKLQWMEKLSPIKTSGVYFRHAYHWHLSLLWAGIASDIMDMLPIRPVSRYDEDIICIAQKIG